MVFKIGIHRVTWIGDGVTNTGSRLLVVCGEHSDGRGVDCQERFSLHISQARQVSEYFFNHPVIASHILLLA